MGKPTFQLSITDKCNSDCFFCISKMTPQFEHGEIDWGKFSLGCEFAFAYGCRIAKITAKGEPLLRIKDVLRAAATMQNIFHNVELQTNGKLLEKYHQSLLGLVNVISISCVHYNTNMNRSVYGNDYPDLTKLLSLVNNHFTMRLTCTLLRNHIGTAEKIGQFVDYFKDFPDLQFSFIEIGSPKEMEWFIKGYKVDKIFDIKWPVVNGKTIYYNQCLPTKGEVRHLVYFPDNKIRTNWENKDSIIWER